MIAKVTGKIDTLKAGSVTVAIEGLCYRILIPPVAYPYLEEKWNKNEQIILHTLYYFEGGFKGSTLIPRLIGFVNDRDREFFELYTTVKGLGEKTALKSMAIPSGEIALSVERGDVRRLSELPGVTKRMAEKIVAELKGKVSSFAMEGEIREAVPSGAEAQWISDGLVVLTEQLGFRRQEAEDRIRKALEVNGDISSTEELIKAIFYQRRDEGRS